MNISVRQVEALQRKAENAQARIKRIKAEAGEVMDTVAQAAEVNLAAFGFGVINGRYSSPEVVGVPVDLLTGGAMHAAAFFVDDGGKHLHNIADGCLASYFSALGVGIGRRMGSDARAQATGTAVTPAG